MLSVVTLNLFFCLAIFYFITSNYTDNVKLASCNVIQKEPLSSNVNDSRGVSGNLALELALAILLLLFSSEPPRQHRVS